MQERELRQLIEEVRDGSLPRRSFIQRMVGLGLTAPMASMMLMHEGIAQTPAPIPYKPTKRGRVGMAGMASLRNGVVGSGVGGGVDELHPVRLQGGKSGAPGQPGGRARCRRAESRRRQQRHAPCCDTGVKRIDETVLAIIQFNRSAYRSKVSRYHNARLRRVQRQRLPRCGRAVDDEGRGFHRTQYRASLRPLGPSGRPR